MIKYNFPPVIARSDSDAAIPDDLAEEGLKGACDCGFSVGWISVSASTRMRMNKVVVAIGGCVALIRPTIYDIFESGLRFWGRVDKR